MDIEVESWEQLVQTCQLCNDVSVIRIKQRSKAERVIFSKFVKVSKTLKNLEVLEISPSLTNKIVEEHLAFPLSLDFPTLRRLKMGLANHSTIKHSWQLDLMMDFIKACPVLEVFTISIPDTIERQAHVVLKRLLKLQTSHPQINIEVASDP